MGPFLQFWKRITGKIIKLHEAVLCYSAVYKRYAHLDEQFLVTDDLLTELRFYFTTDTK